MAVTKKEKEPVIRHLPIPKRLSDQMMKVGDVDYWITILTNFVRANFNRRGT
jgi:hypothetical protein